MTGHQSGNKQPALRMQVDLVTVDLVTAQDGSAGLGVTGTDASQAIELLEVGTEGWGSPTGRLGLAQRKTMLHMALQSNGTPLQYYCLENPMDRGAWWAAAHGVAKSRMQLSYLIFTFHFHALEKQMAAHSHVLAWRIPEMAEPGGLPSMGSHRVGHDRSDLAAAAASKTGSNVPNKATP